MLSSFWSLTPSHFWEEHPYKVNFLPLPPYCSLRHSCPIAYVSLIFRPPPIPTRKTVDSSSLRKVTIHLLLADIFWKTTSIYKLWLGKPLVAPAYLYITWQQCIVRLGFYLATGCETFKGPPLPMVIDAPILPLVCVAGNTYCKTGSPSTFYPPCRPCTLPPPSTPSFLPSMVCMVKVFLFTCPEKYYFDTWAKLYCAGLGIFLSLCCFQHGSNNHGRCITRPAQYPSAL